MTPKKWLHDVFARHVDTIRVVNNDGGDHLSSAGFACETDSVVVNLPFAVFDTIIIASLPEQYLILDYYLSDHLRAVSKFFFSLRAPPSSIG